MNKKKVIIITVTAVLLIGLGVAVSFMATGKDKGSVKAEVTTEAAEATEVAEKSDVADKEKEKVEATETTETAEIKHDAPGFKEEIKQEVKETKIDTAPKETTEAKQEQTSAQPKPKATTEQQNVTEAPATTEQPKPEVTEKPATTEKQKVWHEPVYEQVWVVDVPEHVESLAVDVKYVDQCYCGHIFEPGEAIDAHINTAEQMKTCYGYWTDVPIYTYEDVTIPEQGHYEERIVKEGYWE